MRSSTSPITCLRCRFAVAAFIGGASMFFPSTAYALSLGEVIETVSASPLACFGVGCATGAIVGGLVASLIGKRARNELCEELEEATSAAQRAEMAARRAEARVAGAARMQYAASTQHEEQRAKRAVAQQGDEGFVPSFAVAAKDAGQTVNPAMKNQQTERAEVTREHDESSVTTQLPKKRPAVSVRSALLGRLSKDALDIPVIDRGRIIDAPAAPFMASGTPVQARPVQDKPAQQKPTSATSVRAKHLVAESAPQEYDRFSRSSIIDRRVPKLDESLYPDVTAETKRDMDDFERAMQAIDERLAHESPQDDTAAHVESLVQEEMERNKSESARRYSRSRLTVFEGTGDLNASKRINRQRPRHLAAVSKEA